MKTYWIQNMSNRLISLGDLGVLLQPYQAVNLLDSKHYSFTEEQIEASRTNGSLYKRSDKVKLRKIPPPPVYKSVGKIELDNKNQYPSKIRSLLEHKEFNYDELDVSDEEYAKENAELADEDDTGKFKK